MKISPRLLFLLPALLVSLAARAQDSDPAPPPAPVAGTPAPDASVPAKIDPVKEVEIRKYLEVSGTIKGMNDGIKQLINYYQQQNSSIAAPFWEKIVKEIDPQELVDKTIPLYDKYYSLDDLKAINAFYESPAGQRMLTSTPQLIQDSAVIGSDWVKKTEVKLNHEIAVERQTEAAAQTPPPPPSPAPASSSAEPASAPATP